MTPEQERLRDAFLAECWRPVKEWHQTTEEAVDAAVRNEVLRSRDERPDQRRRAS